MQSCLDVIPKICCPRQADLYLECGQQSNGGLSPAATSHIHGGTHQRHECP